MNNSLFPLQWPPAPVADTSVRLPPLAEQATIALQDLLPVAYSYGSQSKRDEACKACRHAPTFPNLMKDYFTEGSSGTCS